MFRCRTIAICCLLCTATFVRADEPDPNDAPDTSIEQEIDRLTEEVAERLTRIAELEAKVDQQRGEFGLGGRCPVNLIDRRQWVLGSVKYQSVYRGVRYRFSSREAKKFFDKNPHLYAPALNECDPVVWVETQRRVLGDWEIGFYHEGRIVFFVDEESRQKYKKDPGRYPLVISTAYEEEPEPRKLNQPGEPGQ